MRVVTADRHRVPRRAALLCAACRHLQIVPVRGNVGTRLRKLADGQVDALVLAVECRTDDPVTTAQLSTLDHPPTRAAATAESLDALRRYSC